MIEGSLEVEPPTIWRDEKQSREAESEESRVNRKKIQSREMVGKSRNAVFFKWFVGRVGRKVGSLKPRVRSHLFRGEMMKLKTAVARSTFASQNVQNTPRSDHF